MPNKPIPLPNRFWPKVIWQSNGCWRWTGALNKKGYGVIHISRKPNSPYIRKLAHVVAYELVIGQVPDGLELDHLCRNRWCCHPYHLEAVTHAENVARGSMGRLRTSCDRGHEYTVENTRLVNGKHRACRKCSVIYCTIHRQRKRKEVIK